MSTEQTSDPRKRYYVQVRGRTIGPLTEEKVRELYQKAVITDSTLVSKDGGEWKPLSELAKGKKTSRSGEPKKEAPSPPAVSNGETLPIQLDDAHRTAPEGWSVCPSCGRPVLTSAETCSICGAPVLEPSAGQDVERQTGDTEEKASDKRILVAVLLLLFFWPIGLHAFYLGRRGLGYIHVGWFTFIVILCVASVFVAVSGGGRDMGLLMFLQLLSWLSLLVLFVLLVFQYAKLVHENFEDGKGRRLTVW